MSRNYPPSWYEREWRERKEADLLSKIVWGNGGALHFPFADHAEGCACWRCVNRLHLWVLKTWAERRARHDDGVDIQQRDEIEDSETRVADAPTSLSQLGSSGEDDSTAS